MLARVANNLFWMGRYIERSEHIARYLNVNYFSSLDAPNQLSQSRQFVLRSMCFMVGDPELDDDKILLEKERPMWTMEYLSSDGVNNRFLTKWATIEISYGTVARSSLTGNVGAGSR